MDKKIFPFQMVNPSIEHLHAKHSRSGQIIYWTILVVLIGTFACLPFVEVEVNTKSRGMVRSSTENNAILMPANGQIEQIFIKNNGLVKKGDVLLSISSAQLDERIRFVEEKQEKLSVLSNDFEQLAHYQLGKTPRLASTLAQREYQQFVQKENEYLLRIQHAQLVLERQEQLLQSGSVAKVEHEQALYDLQLAQSALTLLEDQYRKNWTQEKERYTNELKELRSQRERMNEELKQYVVKASMDGNITQFSGVQAGNFVAAGQKVAEISANNQLLVETYVSPSDVGLIQKGMDVQFQVDAFNSNQWGLATGKVIEISKDIVMLQDAPVFLVQCNMDQQSLSLSNGYKGNIKKGMTLTSHFSVAKRSLYQLLYDTMDDWLDPSQG